MPYLTEDITGVASGIEYGKKGDKVDILDDIREMILVDNKGQRFFLRQEQLSDEPMVKKKESIFSTPMKSTPKQTTTKKRRK